MTKKSPKKNTSHGIGKRASFAACSCNMLRDFL